MIESSRLSFLRKEGLARISAARVCVVGAGGGGSHMAQQLAHVGVGEIVIIDPDVLEASNVNRVVGTSYADVGRPKAVILAERLAGLGVLVRPVLAHGEDSIGIVELQRSDLVLGAVDGFRTRDNLERICRQAIVPYVDIGLRIATDEAGRVTAVGGQIVTSLPGGLCLRCAGVVRDDLLAADRVEYVASAPEQQVVSMNGLLASQAITASIFLLTRFSPAHDPPVHLVYDGLAHQLLKNRYLPASCVHYPLSAAGWTTVLPKKRAVF